MNRPRDFTPRFIVVVGIIIIVLSVIALFFAITVRPANDVPSAKETTSPAGNIGQIRKIKRVVLDEGAAAIPYSRLPKTVRRIFSLLNRAEKDIVVAVATCAMLPPSTPNLSQIHDRADEVLFRLRNASNNIAGFIFYQKTDKAYAEIGRVLRESRLLAENCAS